jgi:hypothetical protein
MPNTLKLKRLVRELNAIGMCDGFYASTATFNVRCNRARIRKGTLEVHSFACAPAWFEPSRLTFADVYGREITAEGTI